MSKSKILLFGETELRHSTTVEIKSALEDLNFNLAGIGTIKLHS